MNPAVVLLANNSLPFSLYDFHQSGVSAAKLARAYSPATALDRRALEAIRLCLQFQVNVQVDPKALGVTTAADNN